MDIQLLQNLICQLVQVDDLRSEGPEYTRAVDVGELRLVWGEVDLTTGEYGHPGNSNRFYWVTKDIAGLGFADEKYSVVATNSHFAMPHELEDPRQAGFGGASVEYKTADGFRLQFWSVWSRKQYRVNWLAVGKRAC
ncbi:MAG: hypothetical protein JJ896_02725 [Rhodothermales bacterium]|nr:hypothetical protein [Rhodothermales bacterium]MBO6778545.1 hypothetical protein [Rhodothermales bacterium]